MKRSEFIQRYFLSLGSDASHTGNWEAWRDEAVSAADAVARVAPFDDDESPVPIVHGVNCPPLLRAWGGNPDAENGAYTSLLDGQSYCGRCHEPLSRLSPGSAAADAEHAGKVREMMVALDEMEGHLRSPISPYATLKQWARTHRVLLDEIAGELAKEGGKP